MGEGRGWNKVILSHIRSLETLLPAYLFSSYVWKVTGECASSK